jgi:hypothetical protein
MARKSAKRAGFSTVSPGKLSACGTLLTVHADDTTRYQEKLMNEDELKRLLAEAERTGGPVPDEVERLRQSRKGLASPTAGAAEVCCKYYAGMGKYEYAKTSSKAECENFPISGQVVADSYCK